MGLAFIVLMIMGWRWVSHRVSWLPRLRTVAIPLVGACTTLIVCAGAAHAANIDPAGIGDLMPSPDKKIPEGSGTLYESYSNPLLWQLDSDYGKFDVLDPMPETIADVCMGLITALGSGCIVVVQWLFQLVSLPDLEDAITKSIGGAAKGLTYTLLPTAVAVGMLVAWTRSKAGESMMSQLAWVMASAVMAVSLLVSPQAWVGGVDSARQIGSNVALNSASAGIGEGTQNFPFKIDHKPKYTDNNRDTMLRKSADAVWRSYVATPWCVAEFGSLEVCQKFGKELLEQGTSKEKRKEWLQNEVDHDAVGGESVTWRQGHSPLGRVMVTVPALISVALFAFLLLALTFSSLASLLGVLMLLVVGVIFACLWVIPGRPREWGNAWFDRVVTWTLQSTINTMTVGGVLILNTATTTLFGKYGWLPSAGLGIAAAVVGFRFHKVLESIFGMRGSWNSTGAAAGLGGLMALRGATKVAGGIGRGLKKAAGGRYRWTAGRGRGGGPGGAGGPGGRGGDGGPAATVPPSDGGPAGITAPRRPTPPPLPASRRESLPEPATSGGRAPRPLTSRPETAPPSEAPEPAPSATLTRERRRSDTPPPQRSVPNTGTRRRELPAGTSARTPKSTEGTQPTRTVGARDAAAPLPPGRPSPRLRPEAPEAPRYAFRQAPPRHGGAPAGGPRVIRGTVIRSTTHTPSPRSRTRTGAAPAATRGLGHRPSATVGPQRRGRS